MNISEENNTNKEIYLKESIYNNENLTPNKLLIKLLKTIINDFNDESSIENLEIDRDLLLNINTQQDFSNLIDDCKKIYKTSKLTSLHSNRDDKQRFPAVNLLRQIMKCNGYSLTPKVTSLGYCKNSGKKLVKRSYIVKSIDDKN